MSPSQTGSSHSSSWRIFSSALLGLWPFPLSSKIIFQLENRPNWHFLPLIFFLSFFPCIFIGIGIFFTIHIFDFSVAKTFSFLKMNGLLGNTKKIKVLSKKKLFINIYIDSSVSARKLKCPSSAQLGTFLARLSSGNLSSNSKYLC